MAEKININDLYTDKDNDGIPDRIDSEYNPPEYEYRQVNNSELEKLKEANVGFRINETKAIIQYSKSDSNKINNILSVSNNRGHSR